MESKKVLVTGGAGFIGSHVVDSLVEKNYSVGVLDNLSSGKLENLNLNNGKRDNVILYNQDITNDISNVFDEYRPEIVIHMAAQVMLRKSILDPLFDAKTNVLGTINVLETAKNYGIKKFIYTATGGARYGEPEYLPVDENHSVNPCSPYGISKHTAEHYVDFYKKNYGLDYLIFCFGNVYGPRDDPSSGRVTSVFIDKFLKNETLKVYGDGKQTRDFIYVKDLASFIVESIDKNPVSKLFNLANGKQVAVNEIISLLEKISGIKPKVENISAISGEVRDILLDIHLAEQELGWKPKHTYEEGLIETIEWFKQKNSLL